MLNISYSDQSSNVYSVVVVGAETRVTLRALSLSRVVPRLQALVAEHVEAFHEDRVLSAKATARTRQDVL